MAKKIAVLGTGANGAAIGADLTRAGLDVVLIDQWPENVAALRERGARIEMPGEVLTVPVRAFNLCDVCTFTDRFDIVLMLVKAYDSRWAAQLIEPYLKSDGLLVGVQNGMTTKVIADVVGRERTLGCVIEISSSMMVPGISVRDSNHERSWFAVGPNENEVEGARGGGRRASAPCGQGFGRRQCAGDQMDEARQQRDDARLDRAVRRLHPRRRSKPRGARSDAALRAGGARRRSCGRASRLADLRPDATRTSRIRTASSTCCSRPCSRASRCPRPRPPSCRTG